MLCQVLRVRLVGGDRSGKGTVEFGDIPSFRKGLLMDGNVSPPRMLPLPQCTRLRAHVVSCCLYGRSTPTYAEIPQPRLEDQG